MSYDKITAKLKGRGLFIFSDPGGAKPILALASQLRSSLEEVKVISDRQYPFFKDFNIDVSSPGNSPADDIAVFAPDFVFTATSYTSDIELKYIVAAIDAKLPTYSFIDHWTMLKGRFEYHGELIFPDKVLVIDEKAKEVAISDDIPADKIEIFGNPYYNFLSGWRPAISRESFYALLGLNDLSKKLVVFAPDPLSNINGMQTFGFDEYSVTQDLSHFLENRELDLYFICKAHPNQNSQELRKYTGDKILLVGDEIDSKDLMYHAHIVIGFYSNFLVEACCLSKTVYRLVADKTGYDPLEGKGIGNKVLLPELTKVLESIQ